VDVSPDPEATRTGREDAESIHPRVIAEADPSRSEECCAAADLHLPPDRGEAKRLQLLGVQEVAYHAAILVQRRSAWQTSEISATVISSDIGREITRADTRCVTVNFPATQVSAK
jgi:hypothetical protein